MERQEFIKKVAFGGSILFAAPAIFSACSDGNDDVIKEEENNNSNDIVIDLNNATYSELKTVGGFEYKGDIIIARVSETNYIALSSVCTHQGCTVEYASASTEIICPCHQSKFTTAGSVTNGPALTNLKKYTVKVEGNLLTIS